MKLGLVQGIFHNPFENGFLIFTLGVLFILTVYHVMLYFQHKDKIYLLYGAYTFFIIVSQARFVRVGFIADLLEPVGNIKEFGELYTEIYYAIYFVFAFRFLEVKKEFPKWTAICFKALYMLMGICALFFIYYLIIGDYVVVGKGYHFFVIYILLLSIICYVLFFKLKNPLKYYIIVGSLILLVFSVVSLLLYFGYINREEDIAPAYNILYLGFILENLVFSLGLGHKQKLILDERNDSQERLIRQLRENERLKEEAKQKLERDVEDLSKEAEAKGLESIKMRYDKELAELKVTTLRSQMNPHFIFNSLNSIKRYIIDNEKENAVYYLNKFSKLIRKILSASMGKNITLADEIETSQLYVNIENIRFNNSIEFTLNINKDLNLETIKVPSLVLQPFIENAIWHGLSAKKEDKKLSVNVNKENDTHLIIEIVDNGVGRKRSEEIRKNKIHKKESVGIAITEERLDNFANSLNNAYELRFEDLYDDRQNPKGTKVVLKIPLN